MLSAGSQPARAGEKIMMQVSGRSFVIAFLVGATAYFVLVSASGANTQSIAGLDQLIPREKWDEAGLSKLTVAEQQTLAGDITLHACRRTNDGEQDRRNERQESMAQVATSHGKG